LRHDVRFERAYRTGGGIARVGELREALLIAVAGRGRLTPALSLSWGLAWLAVARLTGSPLSTPAAVAALVSVAVIVTLTLSLRLRSAKSVPPRLATA